MKLYYSPGACSLAPHIVACEAGLDIAYEKVDLRSKKTETGADFSGINAKGYVPTLRLDDDRILTEVSNLIQYLGDKAPDGHLLPPVGSIERYRVLEWIGFISTELHKGFGPLFNPATPDDYKAIVTANLHKRFAYLNAELAGHDYLMGDRFTVADAYCFTILNWANVMKLDMSPYANIAAYMQRVGGREKVKQALQHEGLLKAA